MNCKYCGAALPTKGGVCPECGKLIPMSQQKEMRQMLDPRWNEFRSMNTANYKQMSNNDTVSDAKTGKTVLIIIGIIILIIIFAIVKSH